MIKSKQLPLFTRLRLAVRKRRRAADDNIERHEPDRIIPVFMDFLFGIVITAMLAMLAYSFMNGSMANWIANFLAAQDNAFTFEERFAAFTAILIVLTNMVIIFGIALTRVPDNEDVIETISDLGEEIDERFAEFENRTANEIDQVRKMVDDLVTPGREDEYNERLVNAVGD